MDRCRAARVAWGLQLDTDGHQRPVAGAASPRTQRPYVRSKFSQMPYLSLSALALLGGMPSAARPLGAGERVSQ